jgi:hypothetical protein
VFQATLILTLTILLSLPVLNNGDVTNGHLAQPNRATGLERLLGLGFVLPYPYFQRPRYRYPVYDRQGRGTLLYGYGGPETYQYRVFTPIEGHH